MASYSSNLDLSRVLTPEALHVLRHVSDPKMQKALDAVLRPLALLTDPNANDALDGVAPTDQKAIVTLLRPGHPGGGGKLVHPDFNLHVLKGPDLKETAAALAARARIVRGPMAAAPSTPRVAAMASPGIDLTDRLRGSARKRTASGSARK